MTDDIDFECSSLIHIIPIVDSVTSRHVPSGGFVLVSGCICMDPQVSKLYVIADCSS